MSQRALFVCWALLIALLVSPLHAQQWTRFRGPNGTGVSEAKNIPVTWTAQDFDWKTTLPGMGHSSPVVWGNNVFLMSADPEDATRYVLCLDAVTGKIIWQHEYASNPHHLHPRNSFASGTPAVDEQHVYFAWSSPEAVTLKAFDHQGNEVWTRNLGTWTSQHGYGASPIVYGDMVILSNQQQAEQLDPGQTAGKSYMHAFDRQTGEDRWKTTRTTTRVCYSTPCIYQPRNGRPELLCFSTGDGFYSLDPEKGTPNWAVPAFRMRTVNSPIVVGDLVLGGNGSGGGGNYLVALRLGEQPKIAFQVMPPRKAPYVPTPIARGDLVFLFCDRGFVHCINVKDGSQVWVKRVSSGFSGSPIRIDDKLYCIDDEGDVVVLAAEPVFKELARNSLGERSRATPAVSGGRMFLRTYSHLICVGGGREAKP
jgi:outer membrane protein assembly factor BamB